MYVSKETVELLEKLAPRDIDRGVVTKYNKRRNLTLPKMLRKASWRIIVQTVPREIARFI
ncbi:MAG: hypothetical protein QXI65_07190 [Metallosphaera sp.]